MKKSNIIILVAVVVLSALAWWFNKKEGAKVSMDVSPDVFQIKDTASIDKIFITDLKANSVTINKTEKGWMVNDKYFVDKTVLANVFEPLQQLRIKATVAEKDKEAIIRDLATGHKKIEIYQNGKLSRVWFLGSATQDGLGSYIYQEGMESPFIVDIPSWNGNIGPRFFMTELEWRSKQVFRVSPKNIEELSIIYLNDEGASFKVNVTKQGDVSVDKVFEGQPDLGEIIEDMPKKLLYNIGNIHYESFIINPRKGQLDSINNIDPVVANIKIKTFDGRTDELVIKRRPLDRTSFNPKDTTLTFDSDRFNTYKINNQKQTLARMQIQLASKILLSYHGFSRTK